MIAKVSLSSFATIFIKCSLLGYAVLETLTNSKEVSQS